MCNNVVPFNGKVPLRHTCELFISAATGKHPHQYIRGLTIDTAILQCIPGNIYMAQPLGFFLVFVSVDFTNIFQDYLTDTGALVRVMRWFMVYASYMGDTD